jgi:hypothetical protein
MDTQQSPPEICVTNFNTSIVRQLCTFFLLIASLGLFGQKAEKAEWKKQYGYDISMSGVGVTLSRPELGPFQESAKQWVGADVQFMFIHASVGQGSYLLDPAVYNLPNLVERPREEFFVSRASLGASIPLPFLAIGKYTNYNKVLRLSSFVRLNGGVYRFHFPNQGQPVRTGAFEFAPGVRLRFPYGSVDLAMSYTKLGLDVNDPEHTSLIGVGGWMAHPTLTLRLDGLFDGMRVGYNRAQAATYSGSRTESRREYTDVSGRRMEETTVTYSGTFTPKTVAVTDIGKYIGIGLKGTRSGVRNRDFLNPGTIFGVSVLSRSGIMVVGLNLEGGRIGHATLLEDFGDGYHRRPDDKYTDGSGSFSTFNVALDFGVCINNLIYAGLGTAVADDVSTPFSAISMGVSLGGHALWGQRFDDPAAAKVYYDQITEERTHWNDPAESKGGLMGGYFFAWDVGNATFKAQWYRYRRAPMANGLMYSVIWRFGRSE